MQTTVQAVRLWRPRVVGPTGRPPDPLQARRVASVAVVAAVAYPDPTRAKVTPR